MFYKQYLIIINQWDFFFPPQEKALKKMQTYFRMHLVYIENMRKEGSRFSAENTYKHRKALVNRFISGLLFKVVQLPLTVPCVIPVFFLGVSFENTGLLLRHRFTPCDY